jgi:arylsulfatase A-like enzyme
MSDLGKYLGLGLVAGMIGGAIEAAVVNRTGLFFVPFAALAYGILSAAGFLLLGLVARALRRNLLPLGAGAAIAFFVVLEGAFWANKKIPYSAGSPRAMIANAAILAAGIVAGSVGAWLLRRYLRGARFLRPALVVACAAAAVSVGYFLYVSGASSPGVNCILISIDALRPDHLTCYGYQRNTSPNIDRLAEGGTLWLRAFTQCPGSTGGHASMLTGLYTLSHGAYVNGIMLQEPVVTAAEVFRRNGWRTAAFTRNWFISPAIGFGQGFDCFVDEGYGLILGIGSPRIFLRGLALTQTLARITTRPGYPSDTEIADALDWIGMLRRNRFFLFLHIMDTHSPYIPPAALRGRFGDRDPSPDRIIRLHAQSLRRNLTPEESQFLVDRYDEEILSADSKIGMLVERLEELGLRDSTMIVVIADHGEVMSEGGGKQFGHGTLDFGALRIPLVMSLPGVVPEGRRATGTAMSIDVLPTVVQALGLDDGTPRQGLSLLAEGADSLTQDRPAFATGDIAARDEYTVITPQWQYTVVGDSIALHDLRYDPYSTANVLEEYPEIADSLQTVLQEWVKSSLAAAVVPISAAGRSVAPGREAMERLKALGYIQ